jgi:hypothetical protein
MKEINNLTIITDITGEKTMEFVKEFPDLEYHISQLKVDPSKPQKLKEFFKNFFLVEDLRERLSKIYNEKELFLNFDTPKNVPKPKQQTFTIVKKFPSEEYESGLEKLSTDFNIRIMDTCYDSKRDEIVFTAVVMER